MTFPSLDDYNAWADFWRDKIGVNVIPAIGWTKKPIVDWKEWQTAPIPIELHNQWKSENKFKDGMAIVLGKVWHRKDKEGYYAVGIDADNPLAIKEIIQSESGDLTTFATKTLVEQYEDIPDKFHFLMYCRRPILNKDPDIKKPGIPLIEIKCLRRIMYCTPSPNASGKPRRITGIYEPRTLESFEKSDAFEILINDICKKYGLKYLENVDNDRGDNNKSNGPSIELDDKQIDDIVKTIKPYYVDGVKDLIVFSLSGFLYKLNVSKDSTIALIELLTDNERKAVTVAEATYKKNRSEVIGYKRLLDILEQTDADQETVRKVIDTIKSIVTTSSESERFGKYSGPDLPELKGNTFYQINAKPAKFIIAYKQNKQLIEATLRTSKDDTILTQYLHHNKTYMTCIPAKIVRHKNPLTFLDATAKYTMSFVDAAGEHTTFGHKTLGEILFGLRDLGYVLNDGAEGALGAMVQAFKENKLIEDNEDLDFTGFFTVGEGSSKKIISSNIEIKEVSLTDLEDSLKFIEQLAPYYEGRLDLLSTLIQWGVIAPAIFMLKGNNYFLKWLHFYGFPNATKSNSGKIVLGIDGHQDDHNFLLNISRIDTIARLGDILSHTTFPKLVDEADLNGPEKGWLVNSLKSAIEGKIVRSKFLTNRSSSSTAIPALSPLILTSNPPPPFSDSGYMRKIIDRNMPKSESHKEDDSAAIRFKEFLRTDLCRERHLGEFRNWFIMNNQDVILDESRPLPLDLGLKILTAAYAKTGRTMPNWFKMRLPENQLEESIEDNGVIVKRTFETYIDTAFNHSLQFFRMKTEGFSPPDKITDRLIMLVDASLLPDVKRSPQTHNIIVRKGILGELSRYGVTRDQLPNLKALADYMGAEFRKSMGNKVVSCTPAVLTTYFDDIEDKDDST